MYFSSTSEILISQKYKLLKKNQSIWMIIKRFVNNMSYQSLKQSIKLKYLFVSVSVYICNSVSVSVYLYQSICIRVFVSEYLYQCICISLSVSVYLYQCICSVSVFVSVYLYQCIVVYLN